MKLFPAMGKKRMCGCVDVATGKMRICAADIECGCVDKKWMRGCDFMTHFHTKSLLFVCCLCLTKNSQAYVCYE